MSNKSLFIILGCLFVATFVAAAPKTLTEDAEPKSGNDFLPPADMQDQSEKMADVKDTEMTKKDSDEDNDPLGIYKQQPAYPQLLNFVWGGKKIEDPQVNARSYHQQHHKTWTECLLGMKSGSIHDSQITADSEWNIHWSPQKARLDDNNYGWCPNTHKAGKHYWIQVDLLKQKKVTGVVLQGNTEVDHYRVLTYKVLYGKTEQSLRYVKDRYGAAEEFIGCKDFSTPSVEHFLRPVWARFIRIEPTTWKQDPVMHFDLLGC